MACCVPVLNSFMMVDASPVPWHAHVEDKVALFCVQKISLLLLLVAMVVVSGGTNQVQPDI